VEEDMATTEAEAIMEDAVVEDGSTVVGLLARLDEVVAVRGSQQTTVFMNQPPRPMFWRMLLQMELVILWQSH
jgi:hypothetical protein